MQLSSRFLRDPPCAASNADRLKLRQTTQAYTDVPPWRSPWEQRDCTTTNRNPSFEGMRRMEAENECAIGNQPISKSCGWASDQRSVTSALSPSREPAGRCSPGVGLATRYESLNAIKVFSGRSHSRCLAKRRAASFGEDHGCPPLGTSYEIWRDVQIGAGLCHTNI